MNKCRYGSRGILEATPDFMQAIGFEGSGCTQETHRPLCSHGQAPSCLTPVAMAPVAWADPWDPGPSTHRPLCAHGPAWRCHGAKKRLLNAPPTEGTELSRGHAGRSEQSDGCIAGRNTDVASAAARGRGTATALLPQHAALLLEETGAQAQTTQVGIGSRNEA